jgi:hypothetical protein
MDKRIFTVFTCSLLVLTLHSQTSLNALYRDFAHESNVSKVNLNGFVMMLARPFMDGTDSKISSIRVFSLDECKQDVKDRFTDSALHFKDDRYELFINSNEKDEKVRIFFKFQDNMIREMVIMTMGDSPAFIHLKGKIKPSDIESLSNGRK